MRRNCFSPWAVPRRMQISNDGWETNHPMEAHQLESPFPAPNAMECMSPLALARAGLEGTGIEFVVWTLVRVQFGGVLSL